MEKMKEGLIETIMRFADTLHHLAFYGRNIGNGGLNCRGWKDIGRGRRGGNEWVGSGKGVFEGGVKE
jgi:hypothetical protein